jgi:hypothetical protein
MHIDQKPPNVPAVNQKVFAHIFTGKTLSGREDLATYFRVMKCIFVAVFYKPYPLIISHVKITPLFIYPPVNNPSPARLIHYEVTVNARLFSA